MIFLTENKVTLISGYNNKNVSARIKTFPFAMPNK